MLEISTSVEPKAKVSSAGFMLFKNGQIKAAVPIPPIEIVVDCKKSLLLSFKLSFEFFLFSLSTLIQTLVATK